MTPEQPAAFAFHVSHVRVHVDCLLPEVARAMRAVWGACTRPLVPTTRRARLALTAAAGGYAVRCDERVCARAGARLDALPVLEAALYEELVRWHAGQQLLHAALIAGARRTLLLLGASSAGKSSLSLSALRAGYRYGGDEIAVLHARRVWGVPRAVQFDPVAPGAALPAWLEEVDRESYPLCMRDGTRGAVPLVAVDPARVLEAPYDASQVHTVVLAHGARDALRACDALEALAALHEASFGAPAPELSQLVGPGRNWMLTWREPDRALALLAAL